MSGFSELVRGFCVIAVSGGLLLIMSPEGNLKKYVKFVLSLCMVCALLSAFFTFAENSEEFFSEIEMEAQDTAAKTEGELRLNIVKQAKKNMEAELTSLLSSHLRAEKRYIRCGGGGHSRPFRRGNNENKRVSDRYFAQRGNGGLPSSNLYECRAD